MNQAVYRRLFATFCRRPLYWLGWLLEIVATLLTRIWAVIIMAQATSALAAGTIEYAKQQVGLFLVGYVVGYLLSTISSLLVMYDGNSQYRVESKHYYATLTGKDMSFYRDNQTGYIVSMFRQYLDNSVLMSRFIMGDMTRTVISLTVPVVVLAIADWMIGGIAATVVIAQFLYIAYTSSRVNHIRLRSLEAYQRMTAEVSDVLMNIVAFRASGVGKSVKNRVDQYAVDETVAYWKRHKAMALYDVPRAVVTVLGISATFYVAVSAPLDGAAAVGLMVMTLTYMFQILRNVMELPNLIIRHDDLVTKIYPTLRYLSRDHETIRDPEHPRKLPAGSLGITIDTMSFAYEPSTQKASRNVFSDMSLSVQPGEQVGIVGLSGAGKSTLAGLVMRFDDVKSGVIRVGGEDIRAISQEDLHRAIAYVPQEPLLFHRTVRENIAYFMPSMSHERVVMAAKAAHAHEFIKELPNGYDTLVGERGIKLSGGQKQRVAIARAILKDAPIMLFDEATSALDSESEAIIQRALPEILGKRTAMIIAHRLSTVAGLDRIIVLERGNIVEDGTHDELLALGGRYARLWQKQTREQSN